MRRRRHRLLRRQTDVRRRCKRRESMALQPSCRQLLVASLDDSMQTRPGGIKFNGLRRRPYARGRAQSTFKPPLVAGRAARRCRH